VVDELCTEVLFEWGWRNKVLALIFFTSVKTETFIVALTISSFSLLADALFCTELIYKILNLVQILVWNYMK